MKITQLEKKRSSAVVPINKEDSLSWLQKKEIKRKTEFRQAIIVGIWLLIILFVVLIGFYLRSIM